MKRVTRALVVVLVAGIAGPVLACGFEKEPTTASAPAPAATVAKAGQAKGAKAAKARSAQKAVKAPASARLVTSN